MSKDNISINLSNCEYGWNIRYMDGYSKTTNAILSALSSTQDESLLYPMLMCFSQYMELWVKTLLIFLDDSKSFSEMKLDNHCITKIIEHNEQKLKDMDIDTQEMNEIVTGMRELDKFTLCGKTLSEASRFPTDFKQKKLIINFDMVDKEKDLKYVNVISVVENIFRISEPIIYGKFLEYINKKLKGQGDDMSITNFELS